MNTTFENTAKKIRRWSIAYLVIAVIALSGIVARTWVQKACINIFHKEEVLKAYLSEACNNPANLKIITKQWHVQEIMEHNRWIFDQKKGIMIIPEYRIDEYSAEITSIRFGLADSVSIKELENPKFFGENVLPYLLKGDKKVLQEIYASPLLKVNMDEWYKRCSIINKRSLFDCYKRELLSECNSIFLGLIGTIIAALLLFFSLLQTIKKAKQLVENYEEYDGNEGTWECFSITNTIVLFIVIFTTLLSWLFYGAPATIPYLLLLGLWIVIGYKSRSSLNLIDSYSRDIDMAEAVPDLFKESEIITFNWFVPIGEDKKEWKEKMRKITLDNKIEEKKALIERSKEFGK